MSIVKKYTSADGSYYVILDNHDNKEYGALKAGSVLETIHNVEFISEEQYESERPRIEPNSGMQKVSGEAL
ncbi:TPA: hypothetical protein LUJ82_001221 [Acinetobacter baumannii]|uniref:hypothetical protein n=1 Tax=Acinetobacter baumannii TaxID=470 RepID=UPI000E0D522B|nr:hypothetical protein [Acinetobacter baumannii]RDJ50074.1 hypothetical protein AB720_10375 [Acinetobacter baumannii]RDJ61953.1 hypothetical protein AB719_03460 [Acinetobacter baumannii]RDJ62853.1 hypothetical protein AB722_05135 [Acinetobacter baumannii]RDJ66279.1 hypothetical protein AB723_08345 [Acinetobacter baumannii]RDJ90121.1 hypothetical protein AB729_00555 [Acinetobacter baumannii]